MTEQITLDITNQTEIQGSEVEFSYEGYQVVRGEFFAHLFEPSVTIADEKVSVNTACLRKLPDVEYVQFLVNRDEKKLAVKPCGESAKDSFRWAGVGKDGKRKPKTITCPIFFGKVMQLMGWNPQYRYKILGKLIRTKEESIYVFDLTCAETYQRGKAGDVSHFRRAIYPDEWKDQFGVPVKEHQDMTLVKIFDDYTVFRISKEEESSYDKATDHTGHEEEQDADPQKHTEGT